VVIENGTVAVPAPGNLLLSGLAVAAIILVVAVAAFVYWRARKK